MASYSIRRAAEDGADRNAVEAWLAERARGDADDVPLEVMRRLLDPEISRIRVWREFRGLTGTMLATAAGLSAAYVSQIERGQREPGLKALKAIASALKVDLDDLV
jgi:DNA-binding XRE family transcriptional regulator